MTEQPFGRLFNFLNRCLLLVTIIVTLLQVTVWLIDIAVFTGLSKAKWLPPLELLGTWALLPLLRLVFRNPKMQSLLASPYFALIGGYCLVLAAILMAVMIAFQILNWIYHGQMGGGIFYFGTLALVFVWSLRLAKSPDKTTPIPTK